MNFITIRNQQCPNQCNGMIRINSRRKRRLQCAVCGRTWAVYRNEYYFALRSSKEKVDRALLLLREGSSVRSVAKTVDVNPSTIQRWKRKYQVLYNANTHGT